MTREEAIQKVKKLLSLANDEGASMGEVNNALCVAQRFMVKFNISASETSDAPQEAVEVELKEKNKTSSTNKQFILNTVARHFRCILFLRRGRLQVVGMAEDVALFEDIAEYVYAAFEALAKKEQNLYSTRSEKIRVKNTFMYGYCAGLKQALIDNENKYALVVVTPLTVVQHVENLNLRSGRVSNKATITDYSVWSNGYYAGKDVINKRNKMLE